MPLQVVPSRPTRLTTHEAFSIWYELNQNWRKSNQGNDHVVFHVLNCMRCHVGFHADSSHFGCGLMLMEPAAAISSSTSQNDTNKKHLLGYIGKTFDLFLFSVYPVCCYSVTWSIWDLRSNSSPIRFRFTQFRTLGTRDPIRLGFWHQRQC